MLKKLCSMTAVSGRTNESGMLSSEKGFALVVVLVLSGVALVVMTALIYMITSGTKVSGLQKRYKTALDGGEGGSNVFYQLIDTRADPVKLASLEDTLDVAGLPYSATTATGCSGSLVSGTTFTGLAAKLMTSSASWNTACDTSLNIDPGVPSTYDMTIQLGTYNVYAKIVATVAGNTASGAEEWLEGGVVKGNQSETEVQKKSYLHAIEVVSENSTRIDERAKLSILYQY